MQPIKSSVLDAAVVLLFVLPQARVAPLAGLLDKFARNDWRDCGLIHLIKIDDQNNNNLRRITATVRQQIQKIGLSLKQKNVRIQFFEDLDEHARYELEKRVYSPDFITKVSYKKLAADLLEIRLREWGFHWRQAVLAEVSKWQHDDFNDADIEAWLVQFDQVSVCSKRWVGERLLRNFKVWSNDEFSEKLGAPRQARTADLPVCVLRYENGKSADAISVIYRKNYLNLGVITCMSTPNGCKVMAMKTVWYWKTDCLPGLN